MRRTDADGTKRGEPVKCRRNYSLEVEEGGATESERKKRPDKSETV